MIIIENPAARLLEILEKGQSIKKETGCYIAWIQILELRKDDQILLMSRLAKVMNLPNQIVELLNLLNASEKVKKANQHWINKVNQGFINQVLSSKWETFINQIDMHTFDSLVMTSEFLATKSTIQEDNPQKLSEVRLSFQSLLDSILSNEKLDKDIKLYLIRTLQRIIVSIDEYFISGYIPIVDAIETAIGHLAVDSKTEEKKVYQAFYETGVIKELFTALNIISAMVTLETGMPQITNDFFQSLPLLK